MADGGEGGPRTLSAIHYRSGLRVFVEPSFIVSKPLGPPIYDASWRIRRRGFRCQRDRNLPVRRLMVTENGRSL